MKKISDIATLKSGSPQFRIVESFETQVPLYKFYSQTDLIDDLTGTESSSNDSKQIRTSDKLHLLKCNDIVFSLISGTASIVTGVHHNYLYTQNYVKIAPNNTIKSKYLVYLINEDKAVRRQLSQSLQGSQVLKYTLRQVNDLELPQLPTLEKQKLIGDIYFKQLRVQMLRKRVAKADTLIKLQNLKEAINND